MVVTEILSMVIRPYTEKANTVSRAARTKSRTGTAEKALVSPVDPAELNIPSFWVPETDFVQV